MTSKINSKLITHKTSEGIKDFVRSNEIKLENSYNPSEDLSLTFNPSVPNTDMKEQPLSICQNEPKLMHKVKRRRLELEDGEVQDDIQSNEESTPICRFFVRNACTWGSSCRFRHPGTVDMGNYVMFEPLDLPRPKYSGNDKRKFKKHSAQSAWKDDNKQELENSFNSSLQNLKNLMHKAGYTINQSKNIGLYRTEYNDMDTDPYYTHRNVSAKDANKERNYSELLLQQGLAHCPSSHDKAKDWQQMSSQLRTDPLYCSDSESSTTTEYSSTTCSSSSGSPISRYKCQKLSKQNDFSKRVKMSSTPLKMSSNSCVQETRRVPRRSHLISRYEESSSSDSSSYGSSTHTSEMSSPSVKHRRLGIKSMHKNRPRAKNKKIAKIDQINLKKREYLLSKLKEVEKKIAQKEERIKFMQKTG